MAIACASVLVSGIGLAQGAGAGRVPQIKFEKYTLPNGLDVILHEDHSTPIVGVNVWYHVGSKNERPGRTGFAHLFEHMMFQGSEHYDKDYFGPLQKAGGRLNGSTSQDRTNYWETVPANYLELALWMESDRMGYLLPAMTEAKFENQRSVVKNERRQSYENRPYGLVYETLLAAGYPADHSYSWPVIGSMSDLDAASRDDLATFFRRYYHPGNASLAIAGDFDPVAAKRLVEKYFGPIPAGPKVEKMAPQPAPLAESKRIRMTDRVGLPRLYLVWPSVSMLKPDEAELNVLADVLGGGKTSRLYQSLVREKQIAQDVQAYQNSGEIAGAFMVVATARAGQSLADLETAVRAEIAKLQEGPPAKEEIVRAVNQHESSLVRSLQSVGGFGGRADQLNLYNTYTGDPGFLPKDFERYLKVDAAAVQRVAKKYLVDKNIVMEVTPGDKTAIDPDPRAAADQARARLAKQQPQPAAVPDRPAPEGDEARSKLPTAGAEPKFQLPPIHRAKLSNGMQILLVENHALPSVFVNAVFPTGRSNDPDEKLGLSALTAAVWDEGTQKRTAMQIAEELATLGAELSVGSDSDSTAVRLFSLKHNLPAALEIYADVLQNPSFPQEELDRQRKLSLGRLTQVRNDPNALAGLAAVAVLYGEKHPYGRPIYGSPSSLAAIQQADLVSFYKENIRTDRATLIVVGDITAEEAVKALERALGTWKTEAGSPDGQLPPPPKPQPARIVLIDKPGAAQSVISVTLLGAERKSPDYFALSVMNSVFGGQFMSRLNMNLREQKGYTYGARTLFDWRVRQAGPFLATAQVQTAVTAPAIVEFLREFEGMVGKRPVGKEELEFSKTYLTRGYPAQFETPDAVAGQLETLVEYGLPDDYFNTVVPKIGAVTPDEVLRVAKQHLLTENLAVIVVGDRAKVEADLRKLPIGKDLTVLKFDENFRLVPAK
jgi:zinc protease